jgi:hypothetical protein
MLTIFGEPAFAKHNAGVPKVPFEVPLWPLLLADKGLTGSDCATVRPSSAARSGSSKAIIWRRDRNSMLMACGTRSNARVDVSKLNGSQSVPSRCARAKRRSG